MTAIRGVALPVVRNHRQHYYPSSPGNTDKARSSLFLPGNNRPRCRGEERRLQRAGPCGRERLEPCGCCRPGQFQGQPVRAVGTGAACARGWRAPAVSEGPKRRSSRERQRRGGQVAQHPLPQLIVKAGVKHGSKRSGRFGNHGVESPAFAVFPQALQCLPALRQG